MMKFSQRIGVKPATKQIQLESMDEELRNGLWNALKICVFDSPNKFGNPFNFKIFAEDLWHNFYKLPIDTIPVNSWEILFQIRDKFFSYAWFEVYNLLEFVAGVDANEIPINTQEFKDFCNEVLEREFSGYRFVENQIAPITNENEINEIEEAIDRTGQFTSSNGANIHLLSALNKISDKKSPDYRNSIKESISAIESIAKIISSNEKDTLGVALDKIKEKIKLHPALVSGFKQLFGYTSDSDGIRHGMTENPNCDFEDAKFMLVSSSAFINYLIIKADKAGIKLK